MPHESQSNQIDKQHDTGRNREQKPEINLEQQLAEMKADYERHLKEDEETFRMVTDLARGKNRWKDMIISRILKLDEIVELNSESMDAVLELYGDYLCEHSEETMTKFTILESRRLLMRDFFIIKTLLAKIGSDVNNIDNRIGRLEKSLKAQHPKKK